MLSRAPFTESESQLQFSVKEIEIEAASLSRVAAAVGVVVVKWDLARCVIAEIQPLCNFAESFMTSPPARIDAGRSLSGKENAAGKSRDGIFWYCFGRTPL